MRRGKNEEGEGEGGEGRGGKGGKGRVEQREEKKGGRIHNSVLALQTEVHVSAGSHLQGCSLRFSQDSC